MLDVGCWMFSLERRCRPCVLTRLSPPQRTASPDDAELVSHQRTPCARIRRADFPVCRLGGFPAARSFARRDAFGLGRRLVNGNTELESSVNRQTGKSPLHRPARSAAVRCWMFDVGLWALDFRCSSPQIRVPSRHSCKNAFPTSCAFLRPWIGENQV
jgi:hypothetical protein